MKGDRRTFQFGMLQIRKNIAQATRCGHRLVADGRRGQADDIKNFVVGQGEFAAPACAEQGAIECRLVHAVGGIDEDLADARPARATERTARFVADWDITPASRMDAFFAQTSFQLLRCSVGLDLIAVDEDQSCGEVLGNRADIQIVGDRFVVPSELLFASGTASARPISAARVARSTPPRSAYSRK